jgi:phosphonate transport system substrate-binding protein
LALKRQETDPVKFDEVGYVFTQTDSKTILLVLNKIVAAGATDDEKYHTSAKNLDSFKIIQETESFPRHLVSHRPDLPAKLVTVVKEILLHMHQTDEGKQVLQDFENTTRFEEIPARDRDRMAGIRKYVDAEIKLQP